MMPGDTAIIYNTAKSELRQQEIKEKLRVIDMGLEWFEYEMQ